MIPLPYCYKITHKSTGQFYIGSRTSKSAKHYVEDLGIIYFTSSKYVKDLGFENFKIEWVEEFENTDQTYKFEQLIIFESLKNPLCLNKICHFGKPNFSMSSRIHSEETKLKRNKSLTGKKHSDATKLKMSNSKKGQVSNRKGVSHSDSAKLKMSNSKKGRVSNRKNAVLSAETKQKISNSQKGCRYINNGAINTRLSKNDKLPEGFLFGRISKK